MRVPAAWPGAAMVERPRLTTLLATDPPPVTLVCAPAGSGKTCTMLGLRRHLSDVGQPVAWVGVAGTEEGPASLWGSLLDALAGVLEPDLARRIGELQPPRVLGRSFVRSLAVVLDSVSTPTWLVLEDVDQVRDAADRDAVASLLDRVPPMVRVVLTSRTDPALGVARLRVEGRLREVRFAELAFDVDEATTLLLDAGEDLARSQVQALVTRTEGWAVGLRIAALALQHEEDPEAFIARFDGDDHAVADYLVGEVLGQQPDDLLTFLLRTSICRDLPEGLATLLTGRADAPAVLERLERTNMLVFRAGRNRRVFRTHDLFRTFLRAELDRREPEVVDELHDRAAAWYLAHGDPLHALEHTVAAGREAASVEVLRRSGVPAIIDGHAAWLRRCLSGWLGRQDADLTIRLLAAAASLELGDPHGADDELRGIDLIAIAAGPDPWLATLAAIVGLERRLLAAASSRHATIDIPELRDNVDDPDLALLALHAVGRANLWIGDWEAATAALDQALERALARHNDRIGLSCSSHLAAVALSRDDLAVVEARARTGLDLARRRGWIGTPAALASHLGLAWLAHLQGDRGEALTQAQAALESLHGGADPNSELGVHSCLLLARMAVDGPRFADLAAYLEHHRRLATRARWGIVYLAVTPELIGAALAVGERGWAQEFADGALAVASRPGEAALVRALLLRASGRVQLALRELDAVVDRSDAFRLRLHRINGLLLAAELHHGRDAVARADVLLTEAVRLAEPDGVMRPFLAAGPFVRGQLIGSAGRFGRGEPFVARLLDAWPGAASSVPTESLTATELDLLRDLPTLRTLGDIAAARGVSVNTVKTHVRSVYRKLGVSGRREAVEVGRRLDLL
jgi:LuxR family transcriptional regulator, maltose regulon positive regulatory protein